MRPSGKDNGLSYTVREVKTGSGSNIAGYPPREGKEWVRHSVEEQEGKNDKGGYGSPAMKKR